MFRLYLFQLIHSSLLACCSVLSVHGLLSVCLLTSEYFVTYVFGVVFITNMVTKMFCPDKQIDWFPGPWLWKAPILYNKTYDKILLLLIRRDLETSEYVCRDKTFYLPYLLWKHRPKTLATKYSEVKRQTQTVKKNVLNEINKEGTFFQVFKHCRKINRKVSQNLDDLQNFLIKLANC